MARRSAILALFCLIHGSMGCQTRTRSGESRLRSLEPVGPHIEAMDHPYNFCPLKGVASSLVERRPWSGETVQKALTDLIQAPDIRGTVWAAYPVAYRRMTAARDRERCGGGVLASPDLGLALINHHLSDIMTRWLVFETGACASRPLSSLPQNGLCGMMRRATVEKFDALSAAMAMTAVYISSHLAISLAAIGVDDLFWQDFPDPATRPGAGSDAQIMAARLAWLTRYKPNFDQFNTFLANNLKTVADALTEAGMLEGQGLKLAVFLAQGVPCKAGLFGAIRDRAFGAALAYLKGTLIGRHPMMRPSGGLLVLNFGSYDWDAPLPKDILDAEAYAVAAVANPAALAVYRGVLGGKIPQMLTHDERGETCPDYERP